MTTVVEELEIMSQSLQKIKQILKPIMCKIVKVNGLFMMCSSIMTEER